VWHLCCKRRSLRPEGEEELQLCAIIVSRPDSYSCYALVLTVRPMALLSNLCQVMSLKRNTAWNLAGTGLTLLLGVFAIPDLIERIGLEAFGILTLVWTLIGYFSLFDFGLGRALTQQVASSLSSDKRDDIPNLVKSGLRFTAFTGLAGGALLAAVAIPLGRSWLNISLPLQGEAAASLFVAAVGIPLTTSTSGLRGVLEAYEDFKAVNVLRIALGSANFAFPVLSVLFLGTSLVYIVLTLIAARLAVLLAYWLLVR